MTKKYKSITRLLQITSLMLVMLPLLVYIVIAFANGEPHQKLTLGMTLILAIILFIINIVFKYHIRSTVWILLLGIYVCVDKITPLLIILAVTTIIDEFIIVPLIKKYKNLYKINSEIDKRIPEVKEG